MTNSLCKLQIFEGKSFAWFDWFLLEAREIHSCRNSWQIYDSFEALQTLPQMHKQFKHWMNTLVHEFMASTRKWSWRSKIGTLAWQRLSTQEANLEIEDENELQSVCVQDQVPHLRQSFHNFSLLVTGQFLHTVRKFQLFGKISLPQKTELTSCCLWNRFSLVGEFCRN